METTENKKSDDLPSERRPEHDPGSSLKTNPAISAEPRLPNTLSSKQLTAALILITLIPFLLVVALYTTLPVGKDPTLRADVSIGPRAWPNDEAVDARLVPCVILKNPTEDPWENVNLSVNEQFHFSHPETLPAGGEIFVPLKFFHTKGNQFYPPESQELKLLTIYAQIPSGRRAILEIEGSELAEPGKR